jgi:hypothetical protein
MLIKHYRCPTCGGWYFDRNNAAFCCRISEAWFCEVCAERQDTNAPCEFCANGSRMNWLSVAFEELEKEKEKI